ncbi:MAG: cytochrome c [Campylobacterota bacterium]|nr:cytochrome c [Campylobacterota bacterium]
MYKIFLLFAMPLLLLSQDEFISEYEYGQMLYNNPRGISCVSCHGEFGEGKVIATIKDNSGKKQLYRGHDIRDLSLKVFHKALNSNHAIMPRYYLVNKEIITIYKFIKEKNRRLTKPKIVMGEEEFFIYDGEVTDENSELNEEIE